MTTLFKVEKTFAGNITSLARPLTLEDVDIINSSNKPSEKGDFLSSFVQAGYSLKLKQSVINELLTACNIEVNETGRYKHYNSGVTGLTGGWESTERILYKACVEQDITYRGLRTEKTKIARFNETLESLKVEAEDRKSELLDEALEKMTNDIKATVNNCNQDVKNKMRDIVVESRVKDPEQYMSDDERTQLTNVNNDISDIESQLNTLIEKKKALSKQAYGIKRNAITRQALNNVGEQGKAIIESFNDEEKEQHHDLLLM